MALDRLDDPDHPTYGMGQAADLLDVPPAFLRSLDTAGLVSPARSVGGHRRYSRRQLDRVAALRLLADGGHTLASASEILDLRSSLDAARTERDDARTERDDARRERDVAVRERDTAREERDEAREARREADRPDP